MDGMIRKMTRGAYDIQQLRIATGLRVVAQFRERFKNDDTAEADPAATIDVDPSLSEEAKAAIITEARVKADKKRDALLKEIRARYDRVTDGIVATQRKKTYAFDEIFQEETDVWFMENYLGILEQEEQAFKRLAKVLEHNAFYVAWLKDVKGIGPALAGVIISELDPYKAKYASSFWKYSGLDVVAVFDPETHDLLRTEGRRNYKHHLVESTYLDKDGKEQTKLGLSYNPWLKSKLLAVMAPSFLKCGHAKYAPMYYNYKNRQLNRPELQGSKAINAIAHKRALRYIAKQFLLDLHTAWRTHEGLEVFPSYAEAKLGLTHGIDPSAQQAVPA